MTDPLSVAAGVTGFVTFALHGIRVLLEDLDKIKEAPNNVLELKDELKSVERVVASLESIDDEDWNNMDTNIAVDAKTLIESCTKTCEAFRIKVQHWTRHSLGDKLSVLDRPFIGFFKSSEIDSMQRKLQAYKGSIGSSLPYETDQRCTRHGSLKQSHGQEAVKAINAQREQVLLAQRQAEAQDVDLSARLREVTIADDADPEAEIVRTQLKQEMKALDASKDIINAILSTLKDNIALAEKYDNSVHVQFGGNNYGLMMGVNYGPMSNLNFGGR
ncbi:hypothetical protein N7468_007462 [Penicillium chermesinum]|uniref:Azaphilone pigments biosynthesis cluster protein L N-terminal domain-containing protein n=1 Tax=Penicillium chermesinum TaxID=63820 RepID=A0A9W9NUE7_9EURO|nr:uncharacterized protein N7468_007462 [Penicillium chermesinum]KAJ5226237.1 hypothetical protein N7468_007462 [Penicillium chermesinum]